jgi:hypothetical protein
LERVLPNSEQIKPVRYGQDLLWGPISIREAGLYELSCDVVPVRGSTSRWFVRLERADGSEIDRTRTLDPADMVAGPRRVRFLYYFESPIPTMTIRVKSEIGEALSAGRAFLKQVTSGLSTPDQASAGGERFIRRAELPGNVSLYELPGTRRLVYWAGQVEFVPDLVTAIDQLEARVTRGGVSDDETIVECAGRGDALPAARDGRVSFSRSTGDELTIAADSSTGGLLVFNESHDPGWGATLDGRATTVLRVNAVCQGVMLPAGTHEVRFRYTPPGLSVGAALSIAGLMLLGILGLLRTRGRSGTP